MNCINEVLSKNFVPAEFEDFLLQMFQQTFYLLQKLTKESNTNSSGNRLEEIDEEWVHGDDCDNDDSETEREEELRQYQIMKMH